MLQLQLSTPKLTQLFQEISSLIRALSIAENKVSALDAFSPDVEHISSHTSLHIHSNSANDASSFTSRVCT